MPFNTIIQVSSFCAVKMNFNKLWRGSEKQAFFSSFYCIFYYSFEIYSIIAEKQSTNQTNSSSLNFSNSGH